MKQILIILLALLFVFQNLYAGTINIPNDQPTIQVGIVSSSSGDTILVSPGTYYENINFNGKNIVLGSLYLTTNDTSYISETIIDGNQLGCVVVFESGEDSTATLTGFTITNGYSYLDSLRGGGITCINSSSPKLTNLIITNNEVVGDGELYGGGGIYCLRSSSPIMENLNIKGNSVVDGYGGGIYCRDSSNVTLSNLMIADNSNGSDTRFGGGLAINNSRLIIDNSQFMRNQSKKRGGGISIENSNIEISNSTIKENHSLKNGLGGGIYASYSIVYIKDSDISNNATESYSTYGPDGKGGGVYVEQSSIILERCTINENTSHGSGGGVSTRGGDIKIFATSIINNRAIVGQHNSYGGGINYEYSPNQNSLYLEDVVIQNNYTEGSGGGICYSPNEKVDAFKNVTIKNNIAEYKGGGLLTNQNLLISESSGCSIFLNKSKHEGTDVHMGIYDQNYKYELYIDTATVSAPNNYQIYPIKNIDFRYGHALYQTTDSDLYVSVDGSNLNSGYSSADPIKTISRALLIADADSLHPRVINIAQGLYSATTNGEEFPIYGRSYVTLSGENVSTTILDGEKKSRLIEYNSIKQTTFKNIIIQNGVAYDSSVKSGENIGGGGGIYGDGYWNEVSFENLVVRNNRAKALGGGLYLTGNVELEKVQVYNNILDTTYSSYGGAGLFIRDGKVKLVNSTIVNNSVSTESSGSGGLSIGSFMDVSIINSIFWNNYPNNISIISGFHPPSMNVAFSDIQDGEEGIITKDSVVVNWLEGNIDIEPLFVGGNPFDYNLTDSSPCINAGTPFLVWEGDTLINLDPSEYIGEAPDMGALESDVLISMDGEDIFPTKFSLGQNYPNPFNPVTNIEFSIPTKSHVSLIIYNVLGEEVKTLVSGERNAGKYNLKFDASSLSSGVYIYRIKSGSFSNSKKLVLVK